MIIDKNQFFNIQQSMAYIPYEQSRGWHDYQAFLKKSECVYFIDTEPNPSLCAWGMIRRIPFFGKILQIYGESYNNNPTKNSIKQFYEEIAQYSEKRFIFTQVSSSSLYDINYEIGIRQAGYLRPFILTMCPLSIMANLDNFERSREWKHRIKEAQKNKVKFQYIEHPNSEFIHFVVEMYTELSQLKNLGYKLADDSLAILLQNEQFKLFIAYISEGRPLLARIIYVHDDFSYDLLAANSLDSRKIRGSSYYIVDSILEWLKTNGVKQFDFGRIGPGKRSTNSVYDFKAALGSPEVTYNGEWVYSKHKIMERIIYFLLSFKYSRY
jgi:hypothetical protein